MIELQGFKELDNALKKLPDRVQNRVLQKSTRDAMRSALPEMRASAPKHIVEQSQASQKYGAIAPSMRVAAKRKKSKGSRGAVIDTRDSFWAYFLEFGTRSISPKPWFVPAFTKAKDGVLNKLRESLGKGIEKQFKDLL